MTTHASKELSSSFSPVLGFHADFWSKIRVSIEIRCRQVSSRSQCVPERLKAKQTDQFLQQPIGSKKQADRCSRAFHQMKSPSIPANSQQVVTNKHAGACTRAFHQSPSIPVIADGQQKRESRQMSAGVSPSNLPQFLPQPTDNDQCSK